MKKSLMIAGAAIVAIAVPAIAAHHAGGHDGMREMMTKDMTRAEMQAMVKDHFAAADANKDGAITKEEVKARHEARRAERMDAHFKKMDADGNGSISREEFDAGHAARHGKMADSGGESQPTMKMRHGGRHGMAMGMHGKMFDMADANKDGKVTLAEAQSAAMTHFDKVDGDRNGTITPAERMDFWKAKKEEWRAKTADKTS